MSSHLYPTDPDVVAAGRDGFSRAIGGAAAAIAAAAAAGGLATPPPLLVTEFNCGLGIDCADAPFAASFLAHHAARANATAGATAGGGGDDDGDAPRSAVPLQASPPPRTRGVCAFFNRVPRLQHACGRPPHPRPAPGTTRIPRL